MKELGMFSLGKLRREAMAVFRDLLSLAEEGKIRIKGWK